MQVPVSVMIEVDDTIGELGGLDTSALKKAKPGENRIMVYMPEKRHFGFVKLAGKRKVDPADLKKLKRVKG